MKKCKGRRVLKKKSKVEKLRQMNKYKLRRRRNKVFMDIRRSKDDQFYSVIVGKNGKDLYVSETYKQKQSCTKTAFRIANQFLNCQIRDKS